VEGSGSAGAAGAEVEAARESGAWSGPGGGVERAEWSGRARAARGAGWVERSGWSDLGGARGVERARRGLCLRRRLGGKRKELKHRHGRTDVEV
jgi:hypothetical protein